MKCNLAHEKQLRARGCAWIAGIDEAGRGPLAGPVVAAAVILPEKFRHKRLTDSKQLCENRREEIYAELTTRTEIFWAVAIAEHDEVDRLNILRASHAAMRRAVEALVQRPDHVLIDGLRVDGFPIEQTAIIDGDALSFSIAAASVIAKVTRDRLMREQDIHFPAYAFAQHKGYATPLHLDGFASMDLARSIAALFCRFSRRSSRSPENLAHALGRRGEQLAAKHLRANRYKVLYRNFRARSGGEVDLVCRDKTTNDLVFVEVKTRRTRDFGDPAHAVNLPKQQLIARGALAWLRMLDNPAIRFRFDIVEVVIDERGPTLKIVQNAFALPEPYLY